MEIYRNNFFRIKNKSGETSGFTIIEALVLIFVFSIIAISFYNVISLGSRYIIFSKNRIGAVALANEKMEIIRNLNYEDVGTIGGVCSGTILQEEDVLENGKEYKVETRIRYVDDEFDGTLGGSPNDIAYKDYKIVKIRVSWNNGQVDRGEIEIVSRFVPPGLEVASYGDGILSINILSDQGGGSPVSQSIINISNEDFSINETMETDNFGNIMFVGAKESIHGYVISVFKPGHEMISTVPPYPDSNYNPTDIHASVVGGELNIINIFQNKLANIKISAIDNLNNPISGLRFILTGGRKLGTEISLPFNPVYNFEANDETNLDGKKEYDSISPGQYKFEIDTDNNYELIGIDPINPFSLLPDSTIEIKIKVTDKNTTGFLAKIARDIDGIPVAGALVNLTGEGFEYNEEVITGNDGMAFFPEGDNSSFEAGNYSLSISVDGFQDEVKQIIIEEGKLKIEDVLLLSN